MSDFHVSVGEQVTFSKTVGESDVYLFAGITGDLNGLHVNEHYMSQTSYGHRIAHGALLVGFMSTTSTMMIARCDEKGATRPRSRSVSTAFASPRRSISTTR